MKPGNQVRLIIDVDAPNGLIGGADFGTAVTDCLQLGEAESRR
jgi:hypothetical protein